MQLDTFSGFCQLTQTCHDYHWTPQSQRVDEKFIPLINFIGHMETIEQDAKQLLLMKIGAWEEYGKSGWGPDGNESIFQTTSTSPHATSTGMEDSWERLRGYYTPELEQAVGKRYVRDYNHPLFQIRKREFPFSTTK